jgi:hypothetical protein
MKIKVVFTQQQYELIEKLRKEGKFGDTDGEIVKMVFLEFLELEKKVPYQ